MASVGAQASSPPPKPTPPAADERLEELRARLDEMLGLLEATGGGVNAPELETVRALAERMRGRAGELDRGKPTGAKQNASVAQEPKADDGKQVADEQLERICSKLEAMAAADCVWRCRVRQRPADAAELGAVRRVVVSSGGSAGEAFEGELEVLRKQDGTLVALSREGLPRVGVCVVDGRVFREVLMEDEAVDTTMLGGELRAITNAAKLASMLRKAKVYEERSDKNGHRRVRASLPVTALPAPRSEVARLQASRPMKFLLTLTIDGEHAPVEMTARITRSDPTAAVRRMLPKGETRLTVTADDLAELKDVEGAATTYRLARSKNLPAASLGKLESRVRAALAEEDF